VELREGCGYLFKGAEEGANLIAGLELWNNLRRKERGWEGFYLGMYVRGIVGRIRVGFMILLFVT
jgi:hypothetical protein